MPFPTALQTLVSAGGLARRRERIVAVTCPATATTTIWSNCNLKCKKILLINNSHS